MKQDIDIFESPRLSAFDEPEEPELDFEVYEFVFDNHASVGPHNVAAYVEARDSRKQAIKELLHDGWQIDEKIICPPFVTLILSREKETTK